MVWSSVGATLWTSATTAILLTTAPLLAQEDGTANREAASGEREAATGGNPDGERGNVENAAEAEQPARMLVQFNFKNTPYSEVIDFFSRATGLPVIQRVPPPSGSLTYFAPEAYPLDEALRILNIILQTQGVTLTREDPFLYLGKFDKTNQTPTYVAGTLPGEITDEQLVTVLIPLENITANELSERLQSLVGSYGGLTPLPQQNALLLTETAGQVRRLQTIIDALDIAGDYQDQVRIFPIEHAVAADLVKTLKVLMSERVVKYVINQRGEQVKLEEDDLAGLRLEADARTNTIVSKGPIGRLETLAQMVRMLDIPGRGTGVGSDMISINLGRITSREAASLLNDLYGPLPREERPVILPIEDLNSITIVGAAAALQQAMTLLDEVDGGGDDPINFARTTAVLELANARPQVVQSALNSLMTPRQSRLVNSLISPDGRSLILAGPASDVESVRRLVEALDVAPAEMQREVRLIRLGEGDADALLRRTARLYEREIGGESAYPALRVEFERDPESNAVTLIGQRPALDRWQRLLGEIEATLPVERETRQVSLTNARPSQMVGPLTTMARQLLAPTDGSSWTAPTIVPVDQLDTLFVTAPPEQLTTIEALARSLDERQPRAVQFRVLTIENADATALAERAQKVYEQQREANPDLTAVQVEVDAEANALLLVADDAAMARFTAVLTQLQQTLGPARDVRLVSLEHLDADQAATFLRELATTSKSFQTTRGPEPVIEVIESANSLLVAASAVQHQVISGIVRQMDVPSADDIPPVRVMQVETADAENLARTLTQTYDARPAEQRRLKPVTVRADAHTNTLLVSAHPDPFRDIQEIVRELNEAKHLAADGREVRIFPLKVARAVDLAPTLDQMFPQPPVPLDRQGRPIPEAREPREIVVRADAATNSIIVDAPVERMAGFEELVRQLDATEIVADAQLRTYQIAHADLNAVRGTLQELARTGALSPGAAAPGASPRTPAVTVNVEPMSRTLIVAGPAAIFEHVERVLGELDAKPDRPATVLRFYKLEHARADRLAPLVQTLLVARLREELDQPGLDARALLEVTGEPKSNLLIINAPESLIPVVEELVRQLDDVTASVGEPVIRIVTLSFAEAAGVAQTLNQAVPGVVSRVTREPVNVRIAAARGSNAIVLVGPEADIAEVEPLVAALDADVALDRPDVRTIKLRHARAQSVAPIVTQLLRGEQLDQWVRLDLMRRGQQLPDLGPDVRVTADVRLNAVLVSAPPAVLNLAEEIIRQLDVDAEHGMPARAVRFLPLVNADAAQVATNLQQVFAEDQATVEAPVIRVDAASNALIVRATTEQFAVIEGLVREIESATFASAREIQLIPLDRSRADARQTAETLRRLLEQRGGTRVEVITVDELIRRQSGDRSGPERSGPERARPERAGPSPAPASDDEDDDGAQLEDIGDDHAFQLIPRRYRLLLTFVTARLAVIEDDSQRAGPSPNPAGAEDGPARLSGAEDGSARYDVTIAVDEACNSLIVVGSPQATKRLRDLAERIVSQIPPAPHRIRYIPLPDAVDANQMTNLVNGMLNQMRRAPGAGLTDQVAVMADPIGGGLIVSANEVDFEIVGSLIAAMSRHVPGAELAIKVYQLTTVTADRAMQSIAGLIAETPRPGFQRGRQAQRMREMMIHIEGDEERETASGLLDPSRINMTPAPGNDAIIVSAPPESLAIIDRFIQLIDQQPTADLAQTRQFRVQHADAQQLRQTLAQVLNAQVQAARVPGAPRMPTPQVLADPRTSTIIVTATAAQLAEAQRLLTDLDAPLALEAPPLTMIELTSALPSRLRTIIEEVVVGRDPGRRERITVVPDDNSRLLLVRADGDDLEAIREIVREVDRVETRELPIRTVKLERADAERAATALQRFFEDRAVLAQRPGQPRPPRRISIVGDRRSGTLFIAASDEDFAEVSEIVRAFDAPAEAEQLRFEIIPLRHARAQDVSSIVNSLGFQLMHDPRIGPWGGRSQERGMLSVQPDQRTNSIIVSGTGENFALIESVVRSLDVPSEDARARSVRIIPIRHGDVNLIHRAVRETYTTDRSGMWWYWEPQRPDELRVIADPTNKLLVVSGSEEELNRVAAFVEQLDEAAQRPDQIIEIIALQHGAPRDIASTLTSFFNDRARAANLPSPGITMTPSETAGKIVVSATREQIATIRDLLTNIDVPAEGDTRRIRLHVLEHGQATDALQTLRQLFPTQGVPRDRQVIVSADARTNSLVVSAPEERFEEIQAVIAMIDAPAAGTVKIIRTFALTNARATEIASILNEALDLVTRPVGRRARQLQEDVTRFVTDRDGEPIQVDAQVTANARTNSLVVVATPESMPVVAQLIADLDEAPVRSVREYRIYELEHVIAVDIRFTLNTLMQQRTVPGVVAQDPAPSISASTRDNTLIIAATAEQHGEIERILGQLDIPSRTTRTTEFVALQYAQAQKVAEALEMFYGRWAIEADTPGKMNVTIVPDPASNSLVISAEEAEWPGIRELLAKLDAEEYDITLQLEVIALRYADAPSVAQAINQAFAPQVEGRRVEGRDRRAAQDQQGEQQQPRILVDDTDVVRAAAEPLTNSIIVSASRRNLQKIHAIVERLDVADYATLPPAKLIALHDSKASEIAASLTAMYGDERVTGRQRSGRKSVLIIPDAASNTIIVRAEDEEFAQIEALARALEQTSRREGLTVRILALEKASAPRVAEAIRESFAATARQMDEPLSIQVDRASNALVVASSQRMFQQIVDVVEELDTLGPGVGQQIFVVPIENISPEEMKRILDSLGLGEGAGGRGQELGMILSEPIRTVLLPGRKAIAIVGNPADRERILTIVASLDAAPVSPRAEVRLVELRQAEASAVAGILRDLIRPADQHAETPLAAAVKEQIRRLRVQRDSVEPALDLDLTQPIRILPVPTLNGVIVSSTPANCEALVEIARMFDKLPVTDAVTVRLFPLSNMSARMMRTVAEDLFTQGRRLARQPGTRIEGRPTTEVGNALLEEVAMTIDERTNTLIVAGREAAVALVEVLITRLDSDVAARWVEPRVLMLRHADAEMLAETLNAVVVQGQATGVEAETLQRQVGRLRVARRGGELDEMLEADLFVPMSRLLIRPESGMNALIVVGTPDNIAVVSELVAMLDIPAAAPSSTVRIFTLRHASAARVAAVVTNLFDRQVQAKAIREEDRVIAQPDERTNSIIVTTSPRSFAVLEMLIDSLDVKRTAEVHEVRIIQLQNASATVLAPLIQRLMDARQQRLARLEPEVALLEQATIIADARTNSLLITAGQESFEVIERLAAALESSSASAANDVLVIPLAKGNAARVVQTLQRVMDRQYADLPSELAAREKPLILTDTRTNSLLVTASADDLKRITDLVEKLETAPFGPTMNLHVIGLTGVRAEILAPRLSTLMSQREQALGEAVGTADRTVIQPDPASNSLIVAASDENLEILRGLIETLTAHGLDAADRTDVITLRHSRADRMVDQLNALYANEANRTKGAGTVRLTADLRLNAVVVAAPESDLAAIRRLVTELETTQVTDVREIEVIALKAANAAELVSVLESVLAGGRGPALQQSSIIRFIRDRAADVIEEEGRRATEAEINLAVRDAIRLTPELRTNSVVVSAPAASMRMIKELIEELDSAETGSKRVRIFELVNADAIQMAELLRDLFNLRQEGRLYVLRPREDGEPNGMRQPSGVGDDPARAPVASFQDTQLVAVPDERQQLSLTVDPRTNSLIVSGTPRYIELVEQVIVDLDAKPGTRREEFVYALRNARAQEVSAALTDFLTQEQERILRTLGPERAGSILQQLEREVSIVGVDDSNTVMISASPRYMDKIKSIIEELDRSPPQVLISVMLAEVTLDTDDQWGLEGRVGPLRGDRFQAASSFGLASAAVSGLGVPNLSVSTDDFQLLIRALQAQGRLEVLSRPQILVNNNVPARFQVGQDIGLVENVQVSDLGVARSTIERRDIGIILDVLPSISPDRFVRMEVKPEISSLSARTTPVSEDFQAPIIDKRTIDTVVTVKDGQTVVIGGLFSNRNEMRRQKVPIIGDIPIIGSAFRTKLHRREKTELLVVITPHVVGSIEEARQYTDKAILDLTLPETTKDQLRRGEIDGEAWPMKDLVRPLYGPREEN